MTYEKMIDRLNEMDAEQMFELLHDLDGATLVVLRAALSAYDSQLEEKYFD